MRQDDEGEEEPIRRGGDDEEIGGHDLADVIIEERAPGLGGGQLRRAMYFATVA
jgi:hypothetical protein